MAFRTAHKLQKLGAVTIDFVWINAWNREKLGFIYFLQSQKMSQIADPLPLSHL